MCCVVKSRVLHKEVSSRRAATGYHSQLTESGVNAYANSRVCTESLERGRRSSKLAPQR
ncbi:hypothetical protein Fuma_01709 [Fuerstiella marisgermanici]|uniref:Uncharacterized protein n=1 Tax=Fuerstiella marisgermanici TaxID=1891926 RepID=A0A1P8WDF1_9PLAN|nr:hypothetical protein Fuma_01709 [Fuerstiella marisgermanici]